MSVCVCVRVWVRVASLCARPCECECVSVCVCVCAERVLRVEVGARAAYARVCERVRVRRVGGGARLPVRLLGVDDEKTPLAGIDPIRGPRLGSVSACYACTCVRVCERACVRACERASVRACVRACERACVRACVRASPCTWTASSKVAAALFT